jgi:dihydrofolate reductase
MRKLIVNEFLTLDGVMQAPGGQDEDRSGGFEHGGWQQPYFDEIFAEAIITGLAEAGGFVLGRRTWEIFAAYWPTAPTEERGVADPLNNLPKIRRLSNVERATRMDRLDADRRRRRRGCAPVEVRVRQGSPRVRERGPRADADGG